MKRKYILTAFMAVAAVMLGGCQGGSANEAAEIFEDEPSPNTIMQSESDETEQEDTAGQYMSDEVPSEPEKQITYDDLNTSEFCEMFYGDTLRDECIKLNYEFQEVKYDGDIIPQGVVCEVEKILQYTRENHNKEFDGVYWDEWIKDMGWESYSVQVETAVEQIPDILLDGYCEKVFHFYKDGGNDYYLSFHDLKVSSGNGHIRLYEGHGGQYEMIASFETQGRNPGEVILFDGEYYYVRCERNYNTKNFDTAEIYKVGENMREDNVKIRYIPETYSWITEDDAQELKNEELKNEKLKNCIEKAKQEILDEKYIERGQTDSIPGAYNDEVIGIDFANINRKAYLKKEIFFPYAYRRSMALHCKFVFEYKELDNLEYDDACFDYIGKLVQMWFEEIDGTVYTFQLFSRPEYQYMMRVLKVEGKNIEVIWQEQAVPQRKFVIYEREVFYQ